MTKVGEHITLDIIGTTKEYDPAVFEKVINDIAKAAKVTILNISKYKFEPQGFTILALLAESHISFHTFPEKGIISFDFFTCGKISPSIAIDIIKKAFKHKRIVKKEFKNSENIEINRFKGLGEMMPAQLKETTMSPENRTLLKIQIASKDKKKTKKSIEALMGKKPELRFKFITENSKKVSAENIL